VSVGYDVTLPMPLGESMAMYAALGGLAAALANRGLSVFHDGLRPAIASMRSGELPRKEVAATSFALAWGFFWAFGIPFSLGFVIPLVYILFMLSDWIGVSIDADHGERWYRTRRSLRGVGLSLVIGAGYGVVTAVALHYLALGMDDLPLPMAKPVQLFTEPALGAFFLFATLTAAYHFGVRRALPSLVAGSLAWFLAAGLDLGYPPSWAFIAAFAVLLVQLVHEIRSKHEAVDETLAAWATEDDEDDEDDEDLVFDRVQHIRSGIVPIVLLSALLGAAYNWGFMVKDPITGELYALGLAIPAVLVSLAWAFAFLPMKLTTAAVTGCMVTSTFTDAALAMLMPNPWVAAIAVGGLRVVEVLSIVPVVRFLERVPSVREVADVMRTAIFHVMEIAFLIGGAVAAAHWAGTYGAACVIGAWFINARANAPVMPMSVGPVAALIVGVLANVLHVMGVGLQ
jgi:hypothetical protein